MLFCKLKIRTFLVFFIKLTKVKNISCEICNYLFGIKVNFHFAQYWPGSLATRENGMYLLTNLVQFEMKSLYCMIPPPLAAREMETVLQLRNGCQHRGPQPTPHCITSSVGNRVPFVCLWYTLGSAFKCRGLVNSLNNGGLGVKPD